MIILTKSKGTCHKENLPVHTVNLFLTTKKICQNTLIEFTEILEFWKEAESGWTKGIKWDVKEFS